MSDYIQIDLQSKVKLVTFQDAHLLKQKKKGSYFLARMQGKLRYISQVTTLISPSGRVNPKSSSFSSMEDSYVTIFARSGFKIKSFSALSRNSALCLVRTVKEFCFTPLPPSIERQSCGGRSVLETIANRLAKLAANDRPL